MSKLDELKKINAEKKALAEKQKALREELSATVEQRKEARATQAKCRKDITEAKATLRTLSASVKKTLATGDQTAIAELADEIIGVASSMAASVRSFGESLNEDEL